MEFRLLYQGPLPAASSSGGGRRVTEKHRLRKHFHRQLRELWRQHPDLRRQSETLFVVSGSGPTKRISLAVNPAQEGAKTWLEHVADSWQRCGGRFVPLVSREGGFTCSLDILFLRRGNPGDLIVSGGDIDNRIKVLLDGLKMPNDVPDLGGLPLEPDENPFFCLLEDDSLLTSMSVTTDRLLTPQGATEGTHDVCLVIHVTVVNPGAVFAGNRLV